MKAEIKERWRKILDGVVPAGYKKTKVGIVPKEWSKRKLKESCNIKRGASPRPIDYYITNDEKAINWIKIGDVINGKIVSTEVKVTKEGSEKSVLVHAGDLLLSNSMSFGRPYILEIDGCIHDGWLSIEIKDSNLHKKYLLNFLSSSYSRNFFFSMSAGTGVKNLNKKIVSELNIATPPFPEQKNIATILSTWDKAIALKEELIEQKKLQKKWLMQNLLTGKVRLPEFDTSSVDNAERIRMINEGIVPEGYKKTKIGIVPEEWGIKKIKDIASVIMGQSPKSTSYNNDKLGYPLIQGNNDMQNRKSIINTYTSAPTKICGAGDILLTVRAPVGKVGIASYKSCVGRGVCAIRPDNITAFLYYAFIAIEDRWSKKAQGSTFKSINRTVIESLMIPYPPLPDQIAIAEVLTTADREIDLLEKEVSTLKEQKKGLMQLLLTGIVRTKGLKIPEADTEEGVAYAREE